MLIITALKIITAIKYKKYKYECLMYINIYKVDVYHIFDGK